MPVDQSWVLAGSRGKQLPTASGGPDNHRCIFVACTLSRNGFHPQLHGAYLLRTAVPIKIH